MLDESVGGEEGIILLGQALHLLLVLVQLLQVISGHEVNALGLCLVAMLLISQQTNLELLARDMLQPIWTDLNSKSDQEFVLNNWQTIF